MEATRRKIENVRFSAPRQETVVETEDGRRVTLPAMWDYEVAKRCGCSCSTVRRAVEADGDEKMTNKARMVRYTFIEMYLLNR